MKYVVVGAGVTGLTIAERLKNELNTDVVVFEQRNHIGGNCYDEFDDTAKCYVHKYGPHIFHTNNEEVFRYLRKFTDFILQPHVVRIFDGHNYYTIPLNLAHNKKILKKFGANKLIKFNEVKKFDNKLADKIYRKVFFYYSKKQWGKYFDDMKHVIFDRVALISTYDNNWYFQDKYQGLPVNGYTKMFENMANGIEIVFNRKFKLSDYYNFSVVIYTGTVDELFDYKYGSLEYRSLDIQFRKDYKNSVPFKVINFTDKKSIYTRKTNYSLFYNFKHKTKFNIISTEIPCEYTYNNIPYYCVLSKKNINLHRKYIKYAQKNFNIIFAGRLADFTYYNIDQAVSRGLYIVDKIRSGEI